MTDPCNKTTKWHIGLTSGDGTIGISLRHGHYARGDVFMWPPRASPKQIAEKLREAAAFLESQSDE